MILLYAALLMLGAPTVPPPTSAPVHENSPAQAESGRDAASAIKVNSVAEEYAILRRLGLKPAMQSLMMIENHPYDMIRVVDTRTRQKREMWFDIQSFFGKDFAF
jgi:hypothetical protein